MHQLFLTTCGLQVGNMPVLDSSKHAMGILKKRGSTAKASRRSAGLEQSHEPILQFIQAGNFELVFLSPAHHLERKEGAEPKYLGTLAHVACDGGDDGPNQATVVLTNEQVSDWCASIHVTIVPGAVSHNYNTQTQPTRQTN